MLEEKKQELKALLDQSEKNLTTYGQERIEELKRELDNNENK